MGINVSYGSFAFSGIGNEPSIVFDTEINRSSAGYITTVIDKIKLNGVIFGTGELNISGNATDNKGAWLSLATGLSGLRDAFAKDYQPLTIKCGTNTIYNSNSTGTIVTDITFDNKTNDNWLQIIDYTISLSVYNTGFIDYIRDSGFYIKDFEDSYSIQTNQEDFLYISDGSTANRPYSLQSQRYPIYTISRTVSADGIETSGTPALENAKKFVSGLVYANPKINQITSNLTIFDRSTVISSDRLGGQYSIKDSFTAVSGLSVSGWLDTFTASTEVNENLLRTVTINGTVKGLNTVTGIPDIYGTILQSGFIGNISGNKFSNASGGFYGQIKDKIFPRALNLVYPTGSLTGVNQQFYALNTGLNPIPLSINVDHNIFDGTISYTYSYNSRPLSLVSGALSESLNMDDSYATRVYNLQTVFYRMPLPQDIGTYTVPTRSVTYEATFPTPIYGALPSDVKNQIDNLLKSFNPKELTPASSSSLTSPKYISWVTANEESYDVLNGKYTKKYTWQYQKTLTPAGF
jgi:hypothetical protein